MFKLVLFCTITAISYFTALFLYKYLPYAVESFQPGQLVIEDGSVVSGQNSTRRLEYLNELADLPLVGRFFVEQKIFELVSLQKFNESIS